MPSACREMPLVCDGCKPLNHNHLHTSRRGAILCARPTMGYNHRASAKYCNHMVRAVIVSVVPPCFVVISVIVLILDCMPCDGVQDGVQDGD